MFPFTFHFTSLFTLLTLSSLFSFFASLLFPHSKYNEALNCSQSASDSCKALKNIGQASVKLSQLLNNEADFGKRLYHAKTAVQSFERALAFAGNVRDHEDASINQGWVDDVASRVVQCFETLKEEASAPELGMPQRVSRLFQIAMQVDTQFYPTAKADVWMLIATTLLHAACNDQTKEDFHGGLSKLAEMTRPMHEARRLFATANNADGKAELDVLDREMDITQSVISAMQANHHGICMLAQLLDDDEDLDMDLLWEAMDWFKRAELLTRELDVEQEARALSYMGKIFFKVLKLRERASESLVRCIQLAMSAHPRTFDSQEWFQTANTLLSEIQQQRQREEDQTTERERAPILEKLKEVLDKLLEAKGQGSTHFLKFVYATHAPKNSDHKLDETLLPDKLRNVLKTALLHYHPDKNRKEQHGIEWHVLCEEISKVLTNFFNISKSVE